MYPYIRDAVDSGKVLLEWDYSKGQPDVPLVKDTYGSERRKAKTLNFSIAYGKTVSAIRIFYKSYFICAWCRFMVWRQIGVLQQMRQKKLYKHGMQIDQKSKSGKKERNNLQKGKDMYEL